MDRTTAPGTTNEWEAATYYVVLRPVPSTYAQSIILSALARTLRYHNNILHQILFRPIPPYG